MRLKRTLSTLVILVALMLTLPAADVNAATIKFFDYFFSRGVGDSWTYGYTQPAGVPDFTVTITRVPDGVYAGKWRQGNYREPDGSTYYQIVFYDGSNAYLYYDSKSNTSLNPPLMIPATFELETMVPHPGDPQNDVWYFKKVSQLTVPAGTFYNVVLKLDLDKNFGPNNGNILFGLPPSIPYGVTHASWYALHAGELFNMDFDAATGAAGDTYQLKSTNARPGGRVVPAVLQLLNE
jgi:hypothetical protein